MIRTEAYIYLPKYALATLAIFTFMTSLSSQSSGEGIRFISKNWEEILSIAEEEDKLIFVDTYAEWCAPCKVMEEDIFTIDLLGEAFNTHFVSVRIDIERHDGPLIAARYGVQELPTMIFLTSDETPIVKAQGIHGVNALIELSHIARQPDRQLQAWKNRYEEGDRNAKMLYNYAHALQNSSPEKSNQLFEEYLEHQRDWESPQTAEVIGRQFSPSRQDLFEKLLEHKEYYSKAMGTYNLEFMLKQYVSYYASQLNLDAAPDAENYLQLMQRTFGNKGKIEALNRLAKHHLDRKNYTKYADYALELSSSDDHFLEYADSYIDEFIQQPIIEPIYLRAAIDWNEQLIDKNSSTKTYNLSRQSKLYEILDDLKKAKKYAKTAYKLAKKNKDDIRIQLKKELSRLKSLSK